jgi:putative ABC transport system substrate-binding protein
MAGRAAGAAAGVTVIGFLRSTSLSDAPHYVAAFRQGLREAGFIEGQTVTIEYRWAEGRLDRLPILAADLVRQQVALIVGNTPSALAAKAATTTIPIVFVTGGDRVIDGLVNSISRPDGNMTGVSFLSAAVVTKRLELLRQLVPKAAAIAVLVNLNFPQAERERRAVHAAAHAIGQELIDVDRLSDDRQMVGNNAGGHPWSEADHAHVQPRDCSILPSVPGRVPSSRLAITGAGVGLASAQ